MNDDQATVSLLSVPDTYRKGGRLTWHQKRCHRTVLKILKTLEESVLDYGCGYGDLTYAISKTHHACGTDLDPHRVAFAKAEYAPLEFKVCTAHDAPFIDAAFDIVILLYLILSPMHTFIFRAFIVF